MPILRDYREAVANRLGGFMRDTVSLDPEPSDALAQRVVASARLFDAERGSKAYAGNYVWYGRYRDQRRVRENGYSSLSYAAYNQPVGVPYTLTFYGHGVASVPADATSEQLQVAIASAASSLTSVSVSGDGTPYFLRLPDFIDVELSTGEMIANGGIGALQVTRGFTRPLRTGDEFEVHTKLPVVDAEGLQGLNTIINMALRKLWFIDRFPVTPGTNSAGASTIFGLTDYPWLTNKKQIIAVYDPSEWLLSSTLTPPTSGTYTLTLDLGPRQVTTGPIAFDADGTTILGALQAAAPDLGLLVSDSLTPPYTITLPSTYYALAALRTSSGAVVNTRTMLGSGSRSGIGWAFEPDAELPFLNNYYGEEGKSFFIQGYRPAHTWVCPQASYGVLGDTWQSGDGLLNDYDQAVSDVDDVAAVAYYLATKQLSLLGPANDTKFWQTESARSAYVAAAIKMFDLQFEDKPRGGRTMPRADLRGTKGFWGRG